MGDNRPIGIFDSGVGGLTIYLEVQKFLPKESFIYLADQANLPYGAKSKEELKNIAEKAVEFLVSKNVKAVIVACNTATVHAIDFLRTKFNVPIIGIVPVVKTAAEKTKNGRIGVLSTSATAKSSYQKKLIKKFANGLKVENIGVDNIVPFIEKGDTGSPEIKRNVQKVAARLKKAKIDTLALGCSHYLFLKSLLEEFLGSKVLILESGPAVARHTAEVIGNNGIRANSKGSISFFTTGAPDDFRRVAEKLLKSKIGRVDRVLIQ